MPKIFRVYIQQNIIPLYRRPIFEVLSQMKSIEFTIIAGTNSDVPDIELVDEKRSQIRVKTVNTWVIKRLWWGSLSFQLQAVIFVLRKRPDLIITGNTPYSLTSWALLLVGRVLRIPVLLWNHGLLAEESGPKWWFRRIFYKLARGLLLYGDRAKVLLSAKGFDPGRLHVIYNSLDLDAQNRVAQDLTAEEISRFRTDLGIQQGEGLVGFVGRLDRKKRLELLLEAVGLLAARGRRVHIVVVGRGKERDRLLQLATELGIADLLHLLGYIPQERGVGLVLSACDLSVVPSWAGLSVMHAMGYGTPVLIHDCTAKQSPEWEAVQEGVTGFFYKYENVEHLAEKMEGAIFPSPSKPELSENCKAMIRDRYSPHVQAKAIVRAVHAALGVSPSS
jgi:glycosyltransferase involved in cell wall biosynthesis